MSTFLGSVTIAGGIAEVQFGKFDLATYELFLRAKKLPDSQVFYDERCDVFTLRTAARYAPQLGVAIESAAIEQQPFRFLNQRLFDYQQFITREAIEAQRFAIFADCGLGKTLMELEFGLQVLERKLRDGGYTRVLISTLPDAIPQFYEMLAEFHGDVRMEHLDTRKELAQWCQTGTGLAITNHHKFIDGVIPELRLLAAFILDESSILKTGGGTIKWNMSKSAKGIEYKLSCTATPAPNDIMEYASQAGFLERIRHEGEVLWTFFSRKGKEGIWEIKPHALEPFYRFMASWSIYLRDPASYGFADNLRSIPAPQFFEHRIEVLPEQMAAAQPFFAKAKKGVFGRLGVSERLKLSQIAKGFLYEKESDVGGVGNDGADGTEDSVSALPIDIRTRTAVPATDLRSHKRRVSKAASKLRRISRIQSLKPDAVIEIVAREYLGGNQVLVWTVFDEESRILYEKLRDISGGVCAILDGNTRDDDRANIIADYKSGLIDILISKASLLGFALNLQCTGAMVFSGWDDSYERLYQAIKRAVRYGQLKSVRIHLPFIPELEGATYENITRKKENFERDAERQEAAYRQAFAERLAAAQAVN